ncbi:unnamed protein product [Discula destructiva]
MTRSILPLSLQDVDTLTPAVLNETCAQLKTFLFAGHDSTSITICWIIYELSRTPRALKAVREELDSSFGPFDAARDASIVRSKLSGRDGDEFVRRMTYISAVIKESLRLHPQAGSVQGGTKPATGLSISTPQGHYNLDGCWIYINHSLIQRDRGVYGDTADDFVPERWLQVDGAVYPVSAWRPFERGPRICIGQELANIETRVVVVVVAMLARRYDFTKVGLGELELDQNGRPDLDDKGQYKVKSELYSINAKPVDGMMMRVELRGA